jgi:hypothetical protein
MFVIVANNSQHPFGNQAAVHQRRRVSPKLAFDSLRETALRGPALGFAPQPCDWFAFFEDDDAAGPCFAITTLRPDVGQA